MDINKDALNFLVLGKKGSGKSVTGWSILETQANLGDRKAYFYRCPKPELLKKVTTTEVNNINQFDELFHIQDSVVLIDEANLHFDVKSKTINDDLKKLLQLSRQNNTSFIFIVHNSYVFNRGLFCYLDVKIIKELNEQHWELERPHMKKLYREVRVSGKDKFFIDCDEIHGYATVELPIWYDDEFSFMYRKINKPKILFSPNNAKKCEEVRESAE